MFFVGVWAKPEGSPHPGIYGRGLKRRQPSPLGTGKKKTDRRVAPLLAMTGVDRFIPVLSLFLGIETKLSTFPFQEALILSLRAKRGNLSCSFVGVRARPEGSPHPGHIGRGGLLSAPMLGHLHTSSNPSPPLRGPSPQGRAKNRSPRKRGSR